MAGIGCLGLEVQAPLIGMFGYRVAEREQVSVVETAKSWYTKCKRCSKGERDIKEYKASKYLSGLKKQNELQYDSD